MKTNKYSYYSDTSDSFRNITLQEYQNNYPNLLNYYKTLNEDNDEINFIISEINLIQNYIQPVVNNEKTDLEIKGIYDLTNEMIKKGIASYLKIIIFLETKKGEHERKLDKISSTVHFDKTEQNKVYFKVGLLFAESKIYSKIINVDNYKTTKYYYKDEFFDNPNQLSKRLNLGHQYINDSFKGANTNHNIFKNANQLKNIIDYCNENKITIDPEFLNKYTTLVENRQ
ncbi:MAG: hypothetical protein ABI554_12940 [Flavobacterium sp.]